MPLTFVHDSLRQRVVFGSGRVRKNLAVEVERMGAQRAMVIGDNPARMESLTAGLPVTLQWPDAIQHVPVEGARLARSAASAHEIDVLIAVGGGSSIGLAKAIALDGAQPIIAVPTTFAGSEATNVWGMTQDDRKITGVDDRVLPSVVIYDAELTVTLPAPLAAASALNGLAHCIDSLWAPRADPINAAFAGEGAGVLSRGLNALIEDEHDLDAREELQYGAYLAASAFASAGSGLHHKICHVLGGAYDLPHAQTHAIVLPYVLAYNIRLAPDARRRLSASLASTDVVSAVDSLLRRAGGPTSLRELGFEESMIPATVERVMAVAPASNPRPVDAESLTRLLKAAWMGEPAKEGSF